MSGTSARLLRVLRRNAWVIGACAGLAAGAAALGSALGGPAYRASTTLRPGGGQDAPEPGSREVLGAAVEAAGLRVFREDREGPAAFVHAARVPLPPERSAAIRLEFLAQGVAYGPEGMVQVAYGDTVPLSAARFVVHTPPREHVVTVRVVPRDAAIGYLEERLEWGPDPTGEGIELRLTASDPEVAARAVEAVASAYGAALERAELGRAAARRAALSAELRATDSLIARAEAEQAARARAGRRGRLAAELRGHEAYLEGLGRALDRGRASDLPPPPATAAPRMRSLHSRLAGYIDQREAVLDRSSAPSVNHPDVVRLSALIAAAGEELSGTTRSRIRSLRAEIASLGAADPGTPAGTGPTGADLENLRARAASLGARIDADSATAAPAAPVAAAATIEPVRTPTPLPLPHALLLGLALGVAVALVREWVAGRETADVPAERTPAGPVPNLAVIPEVSPSLVAPRDGGDFRPGPGQSAGIAAYDELRRGLLARAWGLRTIVVTSASPGEGKTTTSTNLAAIYARRGLKVVIVECDLRRPSLGRYFEISKQADLVDVLFEGLDWRLAIQLTRTPGLYVLLGEKSFPRAGDSLGGPEMRELLSEVTSEYDIVILDTSPLLVSKDALALAPIVDAVLLVVRATRTDQGTVEDVVGQLREAGANVVGTVLNDPDGAAGRRAGSAAEAVS